MVFVDGTCLSCLPLSKRGYFNAIVILSVTTASLENHLACMYVLFCQGPWRLDRAGEIIDFIARDSAQGALDWIDGLEERLTTLPGLPEQGRVVPEWFEPTARELIYLRHRVIYEVHDDHVEILTIRHTPQQRGGREKE